MEHYFYQEPQGNNNFRDLAKYGNILNLNYLIEVSWSSMIILPIRKKQPSKIQILCLLSKKLDEMEIDPFHIKYMTNYLVFPRQ